MTLGIWTDNMPRRNTAAKTGKKRVPTPEIDTEQDAEQEVLGEVLPEVAKKRYN